MTKASDIKRPRSWVFYGRAGSGKTTLACSFPKPLLLIDIRDDGTDSIADVEDVDVFQVRSSEDLTEAYWWLHDNPGKYKTVVLDTMTQLQQIMVEEKSGGKRLKSGKNAGDWGTMTKQDWGDIAGKQKVLITDFRDLPMEVVFIAQDRAFNVEDDGASDAALNPEIGPRLSPSVMSHLCSSVSIVACTFTRQTITETIVGGKKVGAKTIGGKKVKRVIAEYCVRLGPSASYITKFRKPQNIALPDALPSPTYDGILQLIKRT